MTMLSVLIPIKDERDNVAPLHEQLTSVLGPTGWDYEIVFVDDGSADDSFQLLDDLATRDDRVRWSVCAATTAKPRHCSPASTGRGAASS